MEFVDSHCHPHFDDFAPDPARVVADAQAAGVTKLIVVGTTLEDSQSAIDFAANHKNAWASAGAHPHDAKDFLATSDAALSLRALLVQPKVVAVGEIGLDYYKGYSPKEDQKTVLRAQIEEGLSTDLPFIFHVRDAWDGFWPIIDSYNGLKGVVHSFSAHVEQLDQILSRGLYVGLNGIMTFTQDQQQLEAARKVPLDKLLLETDAPFLAPKPFRGQTCEPKHIVTIAEFLADLRNESLEQLAATTTKNATELFQLEPANA